MEKGKIIFLNGVTSAGKTSIVDAMQNRGDRGEFQSHEQAKHMPQNVEYALEVDTSVLSSEECAEIIVKTIFGK